MSSNGSTKHKLHPKQQEKYTSKDDSSNESESESESNKHGSDSDTSESENEAKEFSRVIPKDIANFAYSQIVDEGTQIWLVKLPQTIELSTLDGVGVNLDSSKALIGQISTEEDDRMYDVIKSQGDDAEFIKLANIWPNGTKKELYLGKPFTGILSITEQIKTSAGSAQSVHASSSSSSSTSSSPRNSTPARSQPFLKVRYLPTGCTALPRTAPSAPTPAHSSTSTSAATKRRSTPSSSKKGTTEQGKDDRKDKGKHRKSEEAEEEEQPKKRRVDDEEEEEQPKKRRVDEEERPKKRRVGVDDATPQKTPKTKK